MERAASDRLGRRAERDRLVRLAAHLRPDERALVEGVYEAGLTPGRIARLSDAHAPTVRRRLRRIERRVRAPIFSFVLSHRAEWDPERRRVAEARWIHGLSHREIVRDTGVSLHRVRRHIDAVLAQYEIVNP